MSVYHLLSLQLRFNFLRKSVFNFAITLIAVSDTVAFTGLT